jgi:hypothetical protein
MFHIRESSFGNMLTLSWGLVCVNTRCPTVHARCHKYGIALSKSTKIRAYFYVRVLTSQYNLYIAVNIY